MVDVDLDGYEEGKRIVASIFIGLKNSTIRNIDLQRIRDLLIPKLISDEVDVTTHTRIMEVSEA